MKGFIALISMLISSITVRCLGYRKHTTNSNTVKYPPIAVVLGFITSIYLIILSILFINQNDEVEIVEKVVGWSIIAVIMTLSMFFIVSGLLWRLEYYENHVLYRNAFGQTKKYYYSDLTKIELKMDRNHTNRMLAYQIQFGKNKIKVEHIFTNFNESYKLLLKYAKKAKVLSNIDVIKK